MQNLRELLLNHEKTFRQKFIEALAKKHSLTLEEAEADYSDFIQKYVEEKYRPLDKLVKSISEIQKPVFLNIRRDRTREDKCKICESNEPNVHEIEKKYRNKVELFEVIEDRHEGALYQIIFHEESEEKKLPLTAIINRGELLKFWAGKAVEPKVYEMYINRSLAQV